MSCGDSRGSRRRSLAPVGAVAVIVLLGLSARIAPSPQARAAYPLASPAPMRPQAKATLPAHRMHVALVVKQPTPTPTYPPVVPMTGRWRGVNIRFGVSGDALYLPDGAGYTQCGWTVWQRLIPLSVDGRFEVITPEGSVRGRFASPTVCEGITTGWRDIDGQWCQQSVTWIAYPLVATPTSTPGT